MTNIQKLKDIEKIIRSAPCCEYGENAYVFEEVLKIIGTTITKVKKTEWDSDSEELKLASLLFSLIKERKPQWKRPDLQKWCKCINDLLRIEHRCPRRIAMVIQWCQQDTFWQSNILSTEKLRKQFDRLEDLMSKDTTFMSRESLKQRQVQIKDGPTMRDLLKEQHG